MRAILKRLLPEGIRSWIRRMGRKIAFRKFKNQAPVVTKESLKQTLRRSGIQEGDVVMVHSSLKGLGFIEGGPQTVIDALLETLGANGTLLMPAFTIKGSMHQTLSDSSFVFDPATSPSSVGAISEVFRKRSDVVRSLHPTHSVCAWGQEALYFTETHIDAGSNFGKDTPFGKLLERKGKILGLGINFAPVTYYHVPEDLFPSEFPGVYFPQPMQAVIKTASGNKTVQLYCHDPQFHQTRIDKKPEVEQFFSAEFRRRKIVHIAEAGNGTMWWISAPEMVDALMDLKKSGFTIYDVKQSS